MSDKRTTALSIKYGLKYADGRIATSESMTSRLEGSDSSNILMHQLYLLIVSVTIIRDRLRNNSENNGDIEHGNIELMNRD